MTHVGYPKQLRVTLLAFAISCIGAGSAHAAYTVIDDDLLPTAVTELREATARASREQSGVPFAKGAFALGPLGRKALDQIIATAPAGASFRIIGRTDAMPVTIVNETNGTQMSLAQARSNSMRLYLMRQGVQAGNITLAPDNSPNPQQLGNYQSQIEVSGSAHRALPTDPTVRPAITANLTPITVPTAALSLTQQAPSPSATPSIQSAPLVTASSVADRDRMLRFINQSVQNGSMDASVALSLIGRLMATDMTASTALPQPVPPAPVVRAPVATAQPVAVEAPTVTASLFVATPALNRKPTWMLDKGMTLRDNLEAWSKKAGWNAPDWGASNYYEVTRSMPLEGDFPDVLKQVADGTGLNFCARKRERYVRVTDSNVRCDN